jgi:hypothetical protein
MRRLSLDVSLGENEGNHEKPRLGYVTTDLVQTEITARFQVFAATGMGVEPCRLVEVDRRFRGA